MSQNWRIGKVEGAKTRTDGYVPEVIISYKDTSGDSTQDWFHRTVERPVRMSSSYSILMMRAGKKIWI